MVFVRQLDQAAQVGADAVIGGVIDKDRYRIGVCLDGRADVGHFHPQRDAQIPVYFGVDVDRHRSAQHQRVDGALVDVAGQDDLVPRLACGQHHALDAAGGPAHHQKGVGGPEGVGGQFLRFLDDRNRMAQIVQRLHGIDVDADAAFPQQFHKLGVAAAALVARHIKRHHALPPELFQRLVDRRPFLTFPVQNDPSFPARPLRPPQQKRQRTLSGTLPVKTFCRPAPAPCRYKEGRCGILLCLALESTSANRSRGCSAALIDVSQVVCIRTE